MLNHNLILKSDELFLAGDITATEGADGAKGLYARDTRFLSRFTMTLGGEPLETLAIRVTGPTSAIVTSGNRRIETADGDLLPLTVAVEEHVSLDGDLRVRIEVHNHGRRPMDLPLHLAWANDFRDLFDIRGFKRKARGSRHAPQIEPGAIRLAYDGLDGATVATTISVDPSAVMTSSAANGGGEEAPEVIATFPIALNIGESWETTIVVTPHPAGRPISSRTDRAGQTVQPVARISTDHDGFNAFLTRSLSDLDMLQTTFNEGSLPAAGIPWYIAPFGRDSLIVGLQTVYLAPRRAEGTLRVLAALQGEKDDPWRGEQPGKILHEFRYGEMARWGEVPHTPYFGTVDATPLWLMLFAETVAWTGDEALYRDLLPNARRALAWIEGPGDPDGDGFVEYEAHESDGIHIVHQVWKDSHDSLNRTDGSPVWGPVAAVEVQGYVYAASTRLADVAEHYGDVGWANELRGKADEVRARVEAQFWLEDEGFYAQALDAEKRPVAAISSNPGHLLFCGLPSVERAARVAARLAASDLDSGWGIRTLSSAMPTYNPMSYHNGSIWPHDNSLIAAGLARYGHRGAANHIASALFDVSTSDPLDRLPELYCGFPRDKITGAPVAYPVSCSPQAWAAASGPLLFAAMLGLRLDLPGGHLLIDPALPPWLDEATLHGLEVRGEAVSLKVRRSGIGYDVASSGPVKTTSQAP